MREYYKVGVAHIGERWRKVQIAFGHDIHHCLGADLARREIRILLSRFMARYKTRRVSNVDGWAYLRSNRHQGLPMMKIRID